MKRSDIKNFMRSVYQGKGINEASTLSEQEEFELAAAEAVLSGKETFTHKGITHNATMDPVKAGEIKQKLTERK